MTGASSLAQFFKRLVGTGSSILLEEEDLDIRLKTCCTDTAENFWKTEWQEESVRFEQSSNIKLLQLNC